MTSVEKPEEVEAFSSTYHTVYDPDAGSLSEALYRAIADAVGIDPATEPIPVSDHIDPDGLDAVFSGATGEAHLTFPVWDLWVVVHGDGHIFVHPPEER